MTEIKTHPAKFTGEQLFHIYDHLPDSTDSSTCSVFDPFAGVGTVSALNEHDRRVKVTGMEIEPEWADQSPIVETGDSLTYMALTRKRYDAVVTSPAYGNRMADSYDGRDGSKRNTYRISLGRKLDDQNGARLHFTSMKMDGYKDFHREAIDGMVRVTRKGGRVIVVVKNFIANGKVMDVVGWWRDELRDAGLTEIAWIPIEAGGLGYGANRDERVKYEYVLVWEK